MVANLLLGIDDTFSLNPFYTLIEGIGRVADSLGLPNPPMSTVYIIKCCRHLDLGSFDSFED